jgi:hypothetical protein
MQGCLSDDKKTTKKECQSGGVFMLLTAPDELKPWALIGYILCSEDTQ